MSVVSAGWYARNATRDYPIADAATGYDDAGQYLPTGILVDCQLRVPASAGSVVFISAVHLSEKLVTLLFRVAKDLDGTDEQPLAAVTVLRNASLGHQPQYVQPQLAGASGFVVLGSLSYLPDYSGRFSSPKQSQLLAAVVRPVLDSGVTSFRLGQDQRAYTGLVQLTLPDPFQVQAATLEIDGRQQKVGLVSLRSLNRDDTEDPLQVYAGPCGGRVDSRTCNDPQPLEFINGVGPDCQGIITLDFRGDITVSRTLDCELLLGSEVSLIDTCRPGHIPAADGTLPTVGGGTPIVPPAEPGAASDIPVDTPSEELPFLSCFDDGWSGLWTAEYPVLWQIADTETWDQCPCDEASLAADRRLLQSRNLVDYPAVVWRNRKIGSRVFRRFTTRFRFSAPEHLPERNNAGIAYMQFVGDETTRRFYAVGVDRDRQSLFLALYYGQRREILKEVRVRGLERDSWYGLLGTILPAYPYAGVYLVATLQREDQPDVQVSLLLEDYDDSDSLPVGLYTQGSTTDFQYLREEAVAALNDPSWTPAAC